MSDDELIHMTGFKLIREMTNEELIEEILTAYRANLEQMELSALRTNVANARIANYRARLLEEAGLKEGPFGTTSIDETDD